MLMAVVVAALTDLDKNNFKSERSFKLALSSTLQNIKDRLVDSNAYPTVIETGGGYHVYQPVHCPTALENVTELTDLLDLQSNS